MRKLLLASAVIAFASIAAISSAQTPAAPDPLAIGGKDTAWFMDRVGRPDTDSEPQAPFKIMGNVYYVGANNIASILVATPQGHILLDTGTQKMAAVVFPNIVKLGFKPADIKVMLISHAHYDHMETMETIRRLTGATVAALEAEVPALVSGHDLGSNETWGQEPLQIGRLRLVQSAARDESGHTGLRPPAEPVQGKAGCVVGQQAPEPADAGAGAVDEDDRRLGGGLQKTPGRSEHSDAVALSTA